MKAGWEVKPLGEVCDTGAGGTPLKSHNEYYEGGTIHWIRSGEVNNRNIIESELKITEEGLNNSSAKLFPPKTVVIAMYGATAGQVGILNIECATNQAVCGVFPNDEFTPEFLYYFFLQSKEKLIAQAVGNAQPNISQSKIKQTEIPIPPLAEQQQIVAILDKAFAAIDQAKANIEQNIANAEELFQSKLNAIFSQKGEGWEEKTLMQVSSEFGRGKSKHRPRNDEVLFGEAYPFIQTGDIRNAEKIISSYLKSYNKVGLAQSKLWKKGTICITIAANIAESAILGIDACFPDSVIGVVVDESKAKNHYVYYVLQYLKAELKAQGKGSAQDNINLGTFKNLLFPFPSLVDQKRIVVELDKMTKKISTMIFLYNKKNNELEELKKSLLQKAFAGELTGEIQ